MAKTGATRVAKTIAMSVDFIVQSMLIRYSQVLDAQRKSEGRRAFAQSRLTAGLGVFIAEKAKGKT